MAYVTVAELGEALGGVTPDPARGALTCDAISAAIDQTCATTFPDPPPAPVKLAALLGAVRLYQRPLAAFGVTGGFDTTAVYVVRTDPDVGRLLVGYRLRFGVA